MEIKLNRYIEITSNVRSGKPCIAGQRITVTDIAITVLTDQPDIPLTHFSPHSPQLIATLVEWMIQQTH